MNDIQENKLSMYYAVQKQLDNNTSIWTSNVPFTTVFNLFKGKIPLIESRRNTQILENTGPAKEKAQKRQELVDKLYFIANRVQSYALGVNNQDLFATVNYTYSALERARDTELSGIATNILAKANANAAALVPYGVTAALLTDLAAVAAAYAVLVAKPRVAKVTTKLATDALADLIKETDEILAERLDREIVFYKYSNPDFYNQYTQARKVVATLRSKLAVSGNVLDDATNEPLKGAKLEITNAFAGAKLAENAKEVKISKKTTPKGNFQITNLAAGTYQVTVSKVGYASQTVTIYVTDGETASVAVSLAKV